MQQLVHVTVQMATVGLPVEVTKLCVSYLKLLSTLRRCLAVIRDRNLHLLCIIL